MAKVKAICLVLLITTPLFSQNKPKLNRTNSLNIGVVVDPRASIKEKGLNIGTQLEYVGWGYARVSITSFSVLTYGYTDLIGVYGVNFKPRRYDRIRYYAGGRFGYIQRSTNIYSTFGLELGMDYRINNLLLLGMRGTRDKRNDFKIWNAPPEMRQSGYIKLGFRL